MRLLLFTALACLISASVFGQGWEQTYNVTTLGLGKSVQQTTDGGYIITGWTKNPGESKSAYLIKTDDNGVEQWSQIYGGTEQVELEVAGNSVKQTTDGGYIIAGSTRPVDGVSDVYLIKTNQNGIEQWSQTYGGTANETEVGNSVQQTTDGGYIITGYTQTIQKNWSDVYLIKTDGNGLEQWSQTFGGEESEVGKSVQQTIDGGYIIAGLTKSFGNGSSDVYLIKTDGNGLEQWSQTYGGTNYDSGYSVQQTTDGGYIIAGWTSSLNGSQEVYLIKTDGDGVEQWSQTFGGTESDYLYSVQQGFSVQQTTDGGYIIAGWKQLINSGYNNSYDSDVYLIKTNQNGIEQWNQTYGGIFDESYEIGYSVQQTIDGGYIITGEKGYYKDFGDDSFDIYLIKTDSEGTLSSSFTIPTPSNRNLEKVIDVLGREVNHTTNQILFHIYDDGSVEKKFVVE